MMKLYRYNSYHDTDPPTVHVTTYNVLRETPRGWWIEEWEGAGDRYKRFVLKGKGKRYAYPDKEDAWQSFVRRKTRQHLIVRSRLQDVEFILAHLDDLRKGADDGRGFQFNTDEEFLVP